MMWSSESNSESCMDGTKDPTPNSNALRSQPQKRSNNEKQENQKRNNPISSDVWASLQVSSSSDSSWTSSRYDCEYEPSHEDPENIPVLEEPKLLDLSEMFAKGALSYLSQQGHHFKLFSLDYYEGGVVGGGARFHHNFQAKPAHDPDAPPNTFFSQIFLRKDHRIGALTDLTVECCVSLGPSHSLPKKRDNRGCVFCSIYIHHPKDGCEGIIC